MRLAERHRPEDDGGEDGHRQRDQPGPVRLHLQPAEQDEEGRERDHRDQRAEEQRVADRIQHLLVHRALLPGDLSQGLPRRALTTTPPEP